MARLLILLALFAASSCTLHRAAPAVDVAISDAVDPAAVRFDQHGPVELPAGIRHVAAGLKSHQPNVTLAGELTWRFDKDGRYGAISRQHFTLPPNGYTVVAADSPSPLPPGKYLASIQFDGGGRIDVSFSVAGSKTK